MKLTAENYRKGFLVDDELLAGISEARAPDTGYRAFVLRHTTGETLGSELYPTLEDALAVIARIPRDWEFDSTHGCGDSECGAAGSGKCPAGGCGKLSKTVSSC